MWFKEYLNQPVKGKKNGNDEAGEGNQVPRETEHHPPDDLEDVDKTAANLRSRQTTS